MKVSAETVVLVTGASSGIGRETALAFACRGAPLFLSARRTDRLAQAAGECRAAGAARVETFPCDLAEPGAGRRVVEEVLRRLGRLDILVANAGYGNSAPVRDYTPEQMARIWQVNYQSGYESIHAVLPGMLARGAGHIFLVASVIGRRSIPYTAAYCVTKFAQVALGEALYFELAGTGVRVTVICPGTTQTEFFDALERVPSGLASRDVKSMQSPRVVAETIARTVGKRRREIHFTASAKAALLANRAVPWLVDIGIGWHLKRRLARAASAVSF